MVVPTDTSSKVMVARGPGGKAAKLAGPIIVLPVGPGQMTPKQGSAAQPAKTAGSDAVVTSAIRCIAHHIPHRSCSNAALLGLAT